MLLFLRGKKVLLALLGVALAAALGLAVVLGVNLYASYRVERQLQQFLQERQWQQRVRWQRLTARVWGEALIQGLQLEFGPYALQAVQVRVSEVRNTPRRQRIRIQAQGLAWRDGRSPLAVLDSVLPTVAGSAALPPLDAEFWLDADEAQDGVQARVLLRQPHAFDAELSLQLHGHANVRRYLDASGFWARWRQPQIWRSAALWLALGQLRLDDLQAQALDRGGIARWNPAQGLRDCTGQPWAAAFASPGDACAAIAAFVQGDAQRLQLRVQPPAAPALGHLWQVYRRRGAQLPGLLGASVQAEPEKTVH